LGSRPPPWAPRHIVESVVLEGVGLESVVLEGGFLESVVLDIGVLESEAWGRGPPANNLTLG